MPRHRHGQLRAIREAEQESRKRPQVKQSRAAALARRQQIKDAAKEANRAFR